MKKSSFRWTICALLFLATTVNYLDRQVLSLTFPEFIQPEFHWTDAHYGLITGFFSIFYAVACLFAGKFIDWMGIKKGYHWAIFIWSVGACLHAACGWATCFFVDGINTLVELRAVQVASATASAIAAVSVWLFLVCRSILALGEAGNFPAAIKVTAEYFPKKDRAFATSIFNAGASVGALAAPLTIPLLAKHFGWELAFVIIGGVGFIWMIFWQALYAKPHQSKYVNSEELSYITQDDDAKEKEATKNNEAPISLFKCFKFRQTWSFVFGKFLTDGVWWFYLFWAPAYFKEQGFPPSTLMGQALIFSLYLIVTVLSIYGGYLPKVFVEKLNMHPYDGRMRAMLIFAFFPLVALFAQPLAATSIWFPTLCIGVAAAGHQAWSANIFSTVSDMFPKSTIASITGMGAMAGGIGAFLINLSAGKLFTYAQNLGEQFSFCGFTGKNAAYLIVFCLCAIAYLIAWGIMKSLVPKYRKVEV